MIEMSIYIQIYTRSFRTSRQHSRSQNNIGKGNLLGVNSPITTKGVVTQASTSVVVFVVQKKTIPIEFKDKAKK